MKRRGDDGTIMMLALGLITLGLALIVVVIDVSSVYLARRSLLAACDGAALAGAQALDVDTLYRVGAHGKIPVGDPAINEAIDDYVDSSFPTSEFPGQQLSARTDGVTVTVTGRRPVDLPFGRYLHALGIGTVTVTASSSAQAQQR